jgi:outer membrane lipoprotein carrier protein
MDFSEPEGDVVVADGEHLWIYYPSMDAKQVFRQPLEGRGGRFDFHREFLRDPGSKYAPEYQGSEALDGHATHVLRLVPVGPSPYREARVWIDAEGRLIRRVVITEENDSVREVTLSGLEVEPELPPEAFRFTPPEGATVIQR